MNATAPVLLCYDGSEDAKSAVRQAGAVFAGRRAVVLSVWQRAYATPDFTMPGFSFSPDLSAVDETAERVAAALAAEGADLAETGGLNASPIHARATGPVSEVILEAAAEHHAAAIVVGSRGLSGLKSVLLGSVSRHVVHHAAEPTFVVRQTTDEPAAGSPVVLCYDGSDDARLAIARAGELFGPRPAVVVTAWQRSHALPGIGWAGSSYIPDFERLDEAAENAATATAQEGCRLARTAGLTAESRVLAATGPLWWALGDAADEHGAAALVLGSRGLSGVRSLLLGSVSSSVLHHTKRPVLLVRHGVDPGSSREGATESVVA